MPSRLAVFKDAPLVEKPDALLRMDPRAEDLFEVEHGAARQMDLRRNSLLGLLFYNMYIFTDIVIIPDRVQIVTVMRLGVVTLIALVILALIARIPPKTREIIASVAVIGVIAAPSLFVVQSEAPLVAHAFAANTLCMVFGNMLMILRFRIAIAFTTVALAVIITSILLSSVTDPGLTAVLIFHAVQAGLFTLYANYTLESSRVNAYLADLSARIRAEAAEADRRELHGLTLTDALTGLPNRRSLDLDLAQSGEDRRSLAIMMIDVDHFKLYNDSLGHPAGDDCLRTVADALATIGAEAGCKVARFGGEEFTLVAWDVSELETARIAQRIVQTISDLAIAHPSRADKLGRVTVSVGAARRSAGQDLTWRAIIAAADEALYAAKTRGRNCWVINDGQIGRRITAE